LNHSTARQKHRQTHQNVQIQLPNASWCRAVAYMHWQSIMTKLDVEFPKLNLLHLDSDTLTVTCCISLTQKYLFLRAEEQVYMLPFETISRQLLPNTIEV